MYATAALPSECAMRGRDTFLYDVSSPKNNHKRIGQIQIERKVGHYVFKIHSVNTDFSAELDELSKKLAERVVSTAGTRVFTSSLVNSDLVCRLLGMPPVEVSFSTRYYGCQEAKLTFYGFDIKMDFQERKPDYPFPPDIIDIKLQSEYPTSLRLSKKLSLSSQDGCADGCLRKYSILLGMNAGGFSRVLLAKHQLTGKQFAIEAVDLIKKRTEFEQAITLFKHLRSSEYVVQLLDYFELPFSQVGCLVETLAQADMVYQEEIFTEGMNDKRIRIIAKQLLEIIHDLDLHHVQHDTVASVDILYYKDEGRLKAGALERARIIPQGHNSLKSVSNSLDALIWGYSSDKTKPDWLTDEMFDFINQLRDSDSSAKEAMKSDVFNEIGDRPKLELIAHKE